MTTAAAFYINTTAPCCAMAALTWHHALVRTLKDVTISWTFGLVTTTALPHASFTDGISYDTASLCRSLQWVCVTIIWISPKNKGKSLLHLSGQERNHQIGRSISGIWTSGMTCPWSCQSMLICPCRVPLRFGSTVSSPTCVDTEAVGRNPMKKSLIASLAGGLQGKVG